MLPTLTDLCKSPERVNGEIDAYTAPEFAMVIQEVATTDSQLIIDLSAVSFMDSSGVSVVADAALTRGTASRIHIRGAAPIVRRVRPH